MCRRHHFRSFYQLWLDSMSRFRRIGSYASETAHKAYLERNKDLVPEQRRSLDANNRQLLGPDDRWDLARMARKVSDAGWVRRELTNVVTGRR